MILQYLFGSMLLKRIRKPHLRFQVSPKTMCHLKPEIEFPFFRFYGLGVATFVHMNNESVLYGTEFNSLIGLLRKAMNLKWNQNENAYIPIINCIFY